MWTIPFVGSDTIPVKPLGYGLLELEAFLSGDSCFFVVEQNKNQLVHWDLAGYLLVAEDPVEELSFGKWVSKTKEEVLTIWNDREGCRTGILLNCTEKISIEDFQGL